MKLKNFLLSAFFLLSLFAIQTGTAKAQFTILPYTDQTFDQCNAIIDKFDVNDKILNPDQSKAQDQLQDASTKNQQANDAWHAAEAEFDKAHGETSVTSCYSLPGANDPDCGSVLSAWHDAKQAQQSYDDAKKKSDGLAQQASSSKDLQDLLGCGIKTGRISLAMAPYFITYIINFMLSLIGLVCVLFIMIGGYFYVFGGMTEEKDKGKNYIKHALTGLVVATLSWVIVNVILKAITG